MIVFLATLDNQYTTGTGSILVRMQISDKATRDIEINTDITLQDFVSRVCANMGLDEKTAQIG